MKFLVTGIEGFVGPHLERFLQSQDCEVIGTYLEMDSPLPNYIKMDLTDISEVSAVISEVQPEYVIHLAGFSSVGKSFEQPELCNQINVEGTKNLLDAIIQNHLKPKILIVSSGEVYGNPAIIPIAENSPLIATSPYAQSRIDQEKLCLDYCKKPKLFIVISRSFNHTGPGQLDNFVISSFAKQIVQIERGFQENILVGNLDAVRDFSDVRDIVRAYYSLIMNGKKGEIYNICSGNGYSIKDLLDKLIALSDHEIIIEVDPDRVRPLDIPVLIGDNSKFVQDCNWQSEIPIEQTLEDVLTFWRNQT